MPCNTSPRTAPSFRHHPLEYSPTSVRLKNELNPQTYHHNEQKTIKIYDKPLNTSPNTYAVAQ